MHMGTRELLSRPMALIAYAVVFGPALPFEFPVFTALRLELSLACLHDMLPRWSG